mgnify:CR=1 FL=1
MPGSRKLGRTTDHRKAMLRAMVTFLLENGQIETTVTRAKEVRAVAEKMITIAKTNDLHSKRQVMAYVTKESVAKKLFDEIAPNYADRQGGYTRIIKTGPRRGDAAEMALIQHASIKLLENLNRTLLGNLFNSFDKLFSFHCVYLTYLCKMFWCKSRNTFIFNFLACFT